MINFTKLFNLSLYLLFVAASITSIAYCIDQFEFWGIPDFNIQRMLTHMQWGISGMIAILLVATTPLADLFVSLCLPIRKMTLRETARIEQAKALVESRYEERFGRKLNLKIKLQDMPHLQGISFGKKSVVVTTGLLKSMNDDELVAVIAHEVGHLHYKEGMMNALLWIACNLICLLSNVLLLGALRERKEEKNKPDNGCDELYAILGFILIWIILHFPYYFLLCFMAIVILWLMQFIDFCTNWHSEYRADRLAAQLGFASGLISFLERIEEQDMRDKVGFLGYLRYSHPPSAVRIDKVERCIAQLA